MSLWDQNTIRKGSLYQKCICSICGRYEGAPVITSIQCKYRFDQALCGRSVKAGFCESSKLMPISQGHCITQRSTFDRAACPPTALTSNRQPHHILNIAAEAVGIYLDRCEATQDAFARAMATAEWGILHTRACWLIGPYSTAATLKKYHL